MSFSISLSILFVVVSCSHGQWFSQLQQPQTQQQRHNIINHYDQYNGVFKPDEISTVNPIKSKFSVTLKPDKSPLNDPIKSEEAVAFNPIKALKPVTFQQKLIQLRQKIERPVQPFPHITDELDDEDDDEDNNVTEELPQEPQVQQRRISKMIRMKSHNRMLPVLIGMVPTPCGKKMYYPKEQFCFHNRPYAREKFGQCGPRIYRKEAAFCFNGQTYNKLRKGICGNGIYDKLTQICLNHRVRNICAGEIFDPRTHFCYERIYNRVFYSMCGKRVYKKTTHYCLDGRVYPKHQRTFSNSIGTAYMPHDLSLWGRSIRRQYLRNKQRHSFQPNMDVTADRKNNVPFAQQLRNRHEIKRVQNQSPAVRQMPQKTPNLRHQVTFNHLHPQNNRAYVKQIQQQRPDHLNMPLYQQIQNPKVVENLDRPVKPPIHYAYTHTHPKQTAQPTPKADMCGYERFDSKTQFCYEGQINKRCAAMAYNPKALLCYRDFLYTRDLYDLCGNDMFNKYTQTCMNGHVLKRERSKPNILVVDNKQAAMSERDRQDQQDILNLSKQLEIKRKEFQERKQREHDVCSGNTYNKRSHFCYNGKLYSRTIKALCGGFLYSRNGQRCLGGQLFPTLDLNKPHFYIGGSSQKPNAYNMPSTNNDNANNQVTDAYAQPALTTANQQNIQDYNQVTPPDNQSYTNYNQPTNYDNQNFMNYNYNQ